MLEPPILKAFPVFVEDRPTENVPVVLDKVGEMNEGGSKGEQKIKNGLWVFPAGSRTQRICKNLRSWDPPDVLSYHPPSGTRMLATLAQVTVAQNIWKVPGFREKLQQHLLGSQLWVVIQWGVTQDDVVGHGIVEVLGTERHLLQSSKNGQAGIENVSCSLGKAFMTSALHVLLVASLRCPNSSTAWHISDVVQSHGGVLVENTSPSAPVSAPQFRAFRRASEVSTVSQCSPTTPTSSPSPRGLGGSSRRSPNPPARRFESSLHGESETARLIPDLDVHKVAAKWWGTKRIDYALYCPDALTAFPTVMRHENGSILEVDGKEVSVFTPSKPREKWLRKRTHVKLRNVTANHRVNDAVANEERPQVLNGRFMYGPLDMVTLTGEKVDIHIMTQPPSGEWVYFDTEITNSSGRVSYTIAEQRRLGIGVYPVKMVHVPSIMGSDPKVRAGAVDVVRHWQELGYLIIYVTGRPDMQKQRVVAWLAQHNFPHGIVSFCDGLVHDPLRHKANFLKSLVTDFITEGYASHLAQLEYTHRSRPAKNTTRMALRKGSFGLPGQTEFLRKRNHLLRTISSQPTVSTGQSAGYRPERTQSHSESDRERDRERSQRSMSLATGCWGRSTLPRLEPGNLGQK
ncbi:putative Membrane-associated phosphatidylinositol transfer protein [Naja naja]|nr:putative Membrane-associated phosphatidylinositol transfer protein [Naja naja]